MFINTEICMSSNDIPALGIRVDRRGRARQGQRRKAICRNICTLLQPCTSTSGALISDRYINDRYREHMQL